MSARKKPVGGLLQRLRAQQQQQVQSAQTLVSRLAEDAGSGHKVAAADRKAERKAKARAREAAGALGADGAPFASDKRSALQELAATFQERQLADSLLDAEDIELKTRLSPQLTVQVATALLVAQEHDLPELAAFAYKLMELRVSLLGEGRKEVVEVSKGAGLAGLHPDAVARMRG